MEDVLLKLKKEELDIAKKWIQTGDVKVYKETFVKEKNFVIPIEREELVIEKTVINSSTSEPNNIPKEIIRIPLSEEQVDFEKHKITLEDICIYKEEVKDIKHIQESLRKEELKIETSGSATVIDTQQQNSNYIK